MLRDARSLANDDRLSADVCIIGAGAAGLSVAQELERHAIRVLILESGQGVPRHDTQRLGDGVIAGRPYYPLDECRIRALGGTTVAWGGWCRPLDEIDFEQREWVPESGWPFDKTHLTPYYERAQSVCRLGRYDYDAPPADRAALPWASNENFRNTLFHVRPLRFGAAYGPVVQRSRHVDAVLNATVLELKLDATGESVIAARAGTLWGGRFTVTASVFVLALGGIENARLLLSSRDASPGGIGNEHDLVGRYFADHLHVPLGRLRMSHGVPDFYRLRDRGDVSVRGVMSLSDAAQRQTRALGFAVTLHDAADPHDLFSVAQATPGYRSLQNLTHPILRGHVPERALHHLGSVFAHLPEVGRLVYRRYVKPRSNTVLLGCRAEQAPNFESRVTLSSSTDRFGVQKAHLDWRLSDSDIDSIRGAQTLLSVAVGADAVEMFPFQAADAGGWATRISGGAHHTGTTRMHRDPRYGVVDSDCRVWGTSNVFVAGSSVFPTGGWAPPTLTIVALAIRLADHLIARAKPAGRSA